MHTAERERERGHSKDRERRRERDGTRDAEKETESVGDKRTKQIMTNRGRGDRPSWRGNREKQAKVKV